MAVHREKITSFYLSTILITHGIERKTIFNNILPVNAFNFFKTEGDKKPWPIGAFSEKQFNRQNSV